MVALVVAVRIFQADQRSPPAATTLRTARRGWSLRGRPWRSGV